MIVNLNLQGRDILVVGGGVQATKRINSLLGERCNITVVTKTASPQITKLAKEKKIKLERQNVRSVGSLFARRPSIVIAATNDYKLNQGIIRHAKQNNIMVYSSDDAESSDFASTAVINIKNTVQIAVYTGGKSPAMAKKLKSRIKRNAGSIVSDQDIMHIRLQEFARKAAKKTLPGQQDRRAFLARLARDRKVKQLIKDNMLKKAQDRAITMLGDWK